MAAPIDSLRTQNVVGSTSVDQEVDLETLADDLDGGTYDPDHTPGLVYRLQEPPVTSMVFRTGKLVCTGAKSRDQLHSAIEQTFSDFRDIGLKVPDPPDIWIHNFVTTADFGSRLNLTAIAIDVGLQHVEYEPEQFPGLVYRPPGHNVVVLLFGSGKVVLTGASQYEEVETALEAVYDQLDGMDLLDDVGSLSE